MKLFDSLKKMVMVGLTVTLTGCVYMNDSNTVVTGKKINDEQLVNFKLNETTSGYVLKRLGAPTAMKLVDENSETWEYYYEKKDIKKQGFIFLFLSDDDKSEKETLHLTFKNKILIRYWTTK